MGPRIQAPPFISLFVYLSQCSWLESYNLPSTKRIIQSRYTLKLRLNKKCYIKFI